jgi:hypothetical protein
MARTSRKQARRRVREELEAERKFYEQYTLNPLAGEGALAEQTGNGVGFSEDEINEIRLEAEEIVNARAKAARDSRAYSVDSPPTDSPLSGSQLIWWQPGRRDRYIPLAEHGSRERELDSRAFVLVAPMILNAMAALTKKMQSLQWFIISGRNLAAKWQSFFNRVEFGNGWDNFVGRFVRAYSESDHGAVVEIVRAAPPWAIDENFQLTERGITAIKRGDDKYWDIVDLHVLDPARVCNTRSREFPIIYENPHDGRRHYMRQYNFMRLLDMPVVDSNKSNVGNCAVSRAIWAAREDTMITRYVMEKLSDNPGSGIVAANVSPKLLSTALKKVNANRDARGVVYYKGLIFLPLLDPTGRFSLEFLNFAGLPDGFDRMEVYNILKEVVAAAFGLDVLELGALPGNQLGSARQAGVLSEKARGKGIGALIAAFTRELREKVLPTNVQFRFQAQDITEEHGKAQVHNIYFRNASLMAKAQVWDADMVNEYLALMEAVPRSFIDTGTPNVEFSDVEATRMWRHGDIIKMDNMGNVAVLAKCPYHIKAAELVVPAGATAPLRKIPRGASVISDKDVAAIVARRHRRSPELAGILNATATGD